MVPFRVLGYSFLKFESHNKKSPPWRTTGGRLIVSYIYLTHRQERLVHVVTSGNGIIIRVN